MSKPGPKPKPSNVHFLHGNPSKKRASELLDDFRPDVELPSCPKHLEAEARAEYKRLGRELERYGLMSKLDRGVLAMAATEWSRYVWAEQRIAALNAEHPDRPEKGLVDITPNGFRQMSVYLIISRKAMELYLKFIAEFGGTPSARTRVSPSSPQLGLPGIEGQPDKPRLGMFA